MIGLRQNVGKYHKFAKFSAGLWVCSSFERFRGSFVVKYGQIVTKSTGSTRLRVWVPLECIVCKKEQWLGSFSVGLAPQKPRLAGVKLFFIWFFFA